MSPTHVFIVGCARTGTTLLRQILGKSNCISIAPETHFIRRFTPAGGWRARKWGNLADDANLDHMIDFMYSGRKTAGSAYWAWLQRNVDRSSFAARARAGERTERGLFELLMQVYAEKGKGEIPDGMMLGEKTPSHLNYIPTLLEWFPNAKVIHTFRDPRAILVSELKKMRKKGREGPKRFLRPLPNWVLEPLELPIELVHTTRAWLDAVRWHEYCQQHYPQNYRLVRFEDLVVEPEREVRELCHFLELPYLDSMIANVQVVGSSFQAGHRGGKGFDRDALDRWKTSLPPALDLWFQVFGGKHLNEFGYA